MNVTAYTLQSGYIAIDSTSLGASKPSSYTRLSIDTLLFTRPTEARFNDAKFSVDVNELTKRYFSNRKIIQNFDFVKETLRTAQACFAVSDVPMWVDLQQKCSFVTQTHVEFLEDTFTFIKTGKRKMSLSSWYNLIVQTEEASRNPFKGNEYTKWRLNTSGSDLANDLPTLLTQWISQPSGIDDLVMSLAVIFSEKNHLKIR